MTARKITLDQFLDALGGNAAVAELVGIRQNGVSNWRSFGYIPPRYYHLFKAIAVERRLYFVPEWFFDPRAETRRAAVA